MSKQQPQQQGGGDNSLAPLWICALLFLTLFLIWSSAHEYIVAAVFQVNIWQAKLINFFLNDPLLQQKIYLMQTLNPSTVDWDQLMLLTRGVGEFSRYPIIVLLVLLSVILYKSNTVLKFKKTHDTKTLRMQEQFNWPGIMPIIKEDLVSQDINQGPWAMALSPMEFARKHHLLRKDDALLDNPLPGMEMTAGIRRSDAKRIFTLQLGPYWEGFERLPPPTFALAGVFLARINRDKDAANHILKTLSAGYVQGKPNYMVARPIVEKYKDTELVQTAAAKHAYLLTVLGELLVAARDDGVVSTSEFLWLKVTDRRLWYMLNCMGRQTPFVEVAGPFAHWRAENVMKRRSLVPMVDEAIKALEIAIKEIKLTPKQMEELMP